MKIMWLLLLGMAPYVSSKHAAGGLSKCVALEVAKEGIRVNTICPGAKAIYVPFKMSKSDVKIPLKI